MAEHNELGKRGEAYAQNYLHDRNYVILETNYRFNHKEVDIIALDREELVFVEVKTRSEHTTANDVITENKIEYLREAAEQYVKENNRCEELRFDVMVLYANGLNYEVELIKGAFR